MAKPLYRLLMKVNHVPDIKNYRVLLFVSVLFVCFIDSSVSNIIFCSKAILDALNMFEVFTIQCITF